MDNRELVSNIIKDLCKNSVADRINELEQQIAILQLDRENNIRKIADRKRRITMLQRYGVENPYQSSEFNNKAIQKRIQKYGRANGRGFGSEYSNRTIYRKYNGYTLSKSSTLRDKAVNTLKERYSVTHPSNSAYLRRKLKCVIRDKYHVSNLSNSIEINNKKKITRAKNKIRKEQL